MDLLLDCWKPPEVLRKYFPGLEIIQQKIIQFNKFFQEVWLVLIILGVQSGYCPSGEWTFRVGIVFFLEAEIDGGGQVFWPVSVRMRSWTTA